MGKDLSDSAPEVFPEAPERIASFPAVGQQRVVAALQQDVAAGRHLLCVTGPAGSGKTVLLRDLRQSLKRGLVGMIEQPVQGRLLFDVAKSLQMGAEDENESSLRRRLAMLLSVTVQARQPIIQIVDAADRLTREDLNVLLHFFPRGHATLILAGRAAPETWLTGCSTSTGDAPIDHCYLVEPLSAEETAGYIRHRLRRAALPENLFEPATLTMIHQESGGLPGCINKVSADALAHAGMQGRVSVMPPAPEHALVAGQSGHLSQATADEIVTAGATTTPVIERQHGAGPSAQLVVTPQQVVRYEPERLLWRTRRLQRSVRLWRTLAIVLSVALTVELTRDAWLGHMPTGFASLLGPAEPPTESVEPERLSQGPAQSMVLDSSTDLAEPSNNTGLHSDFAALHPLAFLHEDAETPLFPNTMNGTEAASPQSTTSAPRQDAKTDQDRSHRLSAIPVRGTPRMTRTQRRKIAQLYAERAEYEFRNGEEGAASLSIQRGLSSDPRNPRLLEMRPKVLEALRQP